MTDQQSGPTQFLRTALAAIGQLWSSASGTGNPPWLDDVRGYLECAERRLAGDYAVDEFGLDEDFVHTIAVPALRLIADNWFRITTKGLENLPSEGPALVVANHSGTVAVDAVMTAVVIADRHREKRILRLLGADFVYATPFLQDIARRSGGTVACHEDAERLLTTGNLVGVYPEGFKGIGKPFSQRYRLQRFGRGGFVAAALRCGVPIVPCSIVGAEEIYPMIGSIKPLAKALGLPYFPVTPTFPHLGLLGAIPLPSKWIISFGEPIQTASYGSGAADDPMIVFELTDYVREVIQQTLYQLLLERGHPFLG